MDTRELVAELTQEIERLQQVRSLLAGSEGGTSFRYGANSHAPRQRRKLSAKARKAISEAQKRRWAKQKKTAK